MSKPLIRKYLPLLATAFIAAGLLLPFAGVTLPLIGKRSYGLILNLKLIGSIHWSMYVISGLGILIFISSLFNFFVKKVTDTVFGYITLGYFILMLAAYFILNGLLANQESISGAVMKLMDISLSPGIGIFMFLISAIIYIAVDVKRQSFNITD